MTTTMVRLYFANPAYDVSNFFDSIRDAVLNASYNLWVKYNVKLTVLKVHNRIFLELDETMATDKYKFSNVHLKGIATYLLKEYENVFKPMKVGNRLFWYEKIECAHSESMEG